MDKILVGTRWPDPWMLEEVTSWIHMKVTEYVYASRRDFVDSINSQKERKKSRKKKKALTRMSHNVMSKQARPDACEFGRR